MPGVMRLPMNPQLNDAEDRHRTFLEEVKRTFLVWALAQGDQLAVWSDEEGFVLPVWSDEQQARKGLKAFPDHEVRSYPLDRFIKDVLPGLQTRALMIGLNLDASLGGIDISPAEFTRLLGKGDA
jgi:Protein of unknown function (DUF2750)